MDRQNFSKKQWNENTGLASAKKLALLVIKQAH